jgi:hypothetical protein
MRHGGGVQVTLNCECERILRQARLGTAGIQKPASWYNFYWMNGKTHTGKICYWPNGKPRLSCGYRTTQTFDTRDASKTPCTTPPCHKRGRCRAAC